MEGSNMTNIPQPFFFTTYARTLISDWQPVKRWIQEHTVSALKERHQQSSESTPELISEAQLDEITSGPYHPFLKNTYIAYAKLVYARQQYRMFSDDTFKEFAASHKHKLTDKEMETLSNFNFTELQKDLTALFKDSHESWDMVIRQWQQAIIQPLMQHQLTEREIEEFTAFDPLNEILNRFNDLNLDTPKYKKNSMNFAEYLKLKTFLLLYSALSRQHIPHTQTDLTAAIKPLKSLFSQIQQQDKELNQQQASQYEAIIQPIQFIKINQP